MSMSRSTGGESRMHSRVGSRPEGVYSMSALQRADELQKTHRDCRRGEMSIRLDRSNQLWRDHQRDWHGLVSIQRIH